MQDHQQRERRRARSRLQDLQKQRGGPKKPASIGRFGRRVPEVPRPGATSGGDRHPSPRQRRGESPGHRKGSATNQLHLGWKNPPAELPTAQLLRQKRDQGPPRRLRRVHHRAAVFRAGRRRHGHLGLVRESILTQLFLKSSLHEQKRSGSSRQNSF
ncbi:Hypothetical_protein [Hexamita inflata]|uniref:Hypothetical_protein n=1 Tax=Hexamita inflata TaxID=28002 RepID=A0AA86QYW0_9EUKA|nr:Hypothetical protein HINF_LOCUS53502 [Hexamita inflata]